MTDVATLEGCEVTLRDFGVVRNLGERDASPNARILKHSSEFGSLGLLVRREVSDISADREIKNVRALAAIIHGRRRGWGMHNNVRKPSIYWIVHSAIKQVRSASRISTATV